MASKASDSAKALSDLSPYEFYPFAVYFEKFENPKYYKDPYRRYQSFAHAKTGAKGLLATYGGSVVFYQFNFDAEQWEILNA